MKLSVCMRLFWREVREKARLENSSREGHLEGSVLLVGMDMSWVDSLAMLREDESKRFAIATKKQEGRESGSKGRGEMCLVQRKWKWQTTSTHIQSMTASGIPEVAGANSLSAGNKRVKGRESVERSASRVEAVESGRVTCLGLRFVPGLGLTGSSDAASSKQCETAHQHTRNPTTSRPNEILTEAKG